MPKNPGKEREYTPIQRRTLTKFSEIENLEYINPQEYTISRTQFLLKINWTESTLQFEASPTR